MKRGVRKRFPPNRWRSMSQSRITARENRRRKRREQRLSPYLHGERDPTIRDSKALKDLTPYNAVLLMRGEAEKLRWK